MMLKCTCAAETGRVHLVSGTPCQDKVVAHRSGELALAVLADGAGSVPHSERAAKAVTEAVAALLGERFAELCSLENKALIARLLDCAQSAVAREAPGQEADCTLLLAALHHDGRCLLGHIGDGVILFADGEGHGGVVSYPENGAQSHLTYFVSGPEPEEHLRIYRTLPRGTRGILLSSDGIADMLYFEPGGNLASAVGTMLQWLRVLGEAQVAEKLRYEMAHLFSENTIDDMSLALLLREPEEGEQAENESEEGDRKVWDTLSEDKQFDVIVSLEEDTEDEDLAEAYEETEEEPIDELAEPEDEPYPDELEDSWPEDELLLPEDEQKERIR